MKNTSYIKNILVAGTLTGLVLTVVVAFRFTDTPPAVTENVEAAPVAPVVEVAPQPDVSLEHLTALQAQNEELRQLVETMQAREQEYQSQLTAAGTLQERNGELVQALEAAQANTRQQQAQLEAAAALQTQNNELIQALETLQAREQEYQTQLAAASTLQAQNNELIQAVEALQARELQYRSQLETANQTIQQLQEALVNANNQGGYSGHGEDDDD